MENHLEPNFRKMVNDDLDRIAQLEVICFRSPWTKGMLKSELKNKASHYHVIELGGKIIAYAGMWVILNEAHITNVAVDPDFRGRGFGRDIMLLSMREALLFGAEQMTLEVRKTNTIAQKMYASLDFEVAGTRKRYYQDTGEDALILWNKSIESTLNRLRG